MTLSRSNGSDGDSGPVLVYIPAGRYRELWTGERLDGSLRLVIRSKDGRDEVKLWWSLDGFDGVVELGCRTREARIRLPAVEKGMVKPPALVAFAPADTVVLVEDREREIRLAEVEERMARERDRRGSASSSLPTPESGPPRRQKEH